MTPQGAPIQSLCARSIGKPKGGIVRRRLLLSPFLPVRLSDGNPSLANVVNPVPARASWPADGADRPAGGVARPNSGAARPNNGAAQPNSGADRPNSGAAQPNSGAARPNSGAARPAGGANWPAGGANWSAGRCRLACRACNVRVLTGRRHSSIRMRVHFRLATTEGARIGPSSHLFRCKKEKDVIIDAIIGTVRTNQRRAR